MISTAAIELALAKLNVTVESGASEQTCLRRWSEFIRLRDDNRCVDCHSRSGLAAHHICRKTFLPEARFQTGNGITLCRGCHHEVHKGFNGRPALSAPMDEQGGEKLDHMERLYCILADDGVERGIPRDDFYFLSDQVLAKFKLFQGFEWTTAFPGNRVRQAYLIWTRSDLNTTRAILEASGFARSS